MRPLLITSLHNDHFVALKGLHESKGIRKQQRFLVSGMKVVEETLQHHAADIIGVVIESTDSESRRRFEKLPLILLEKALFHEVDQFGCHSPILICKLPEIPAWNPDEEGLHLLLTQGDPSNLGAAIRTAQAFAVDRIVLLKESANPFHPKVLRAASSANLSAPFAVGPSLKELGAPSTPRVALDLKGISMTEFQWPRQVQLLVGEEGPGLPQEPQASRVFIPIAKKVESLNATVETSLALYSYRQSYPLL